MDPDEIRPEDLLTWFTPSECAVLHLIFLKHRVLVDNKQLPKLHTKNGEMSQIENKLFSGALLEDLYEKLEVE